MVVTMTLMQSLDEDHLTPGQFVREIKVSRQWLLQESILEIVTMPGLFYDNV